MTAEKCIKMQAVPGRRLASQSKYLNPMKPFPIVPRIRLGKPLPVFAGLDVSIDPRGTAQNLPPPGPISH